MSKAYVATLMVLVLAAAEPGPAAADASAFKSYCEKCHERAARLASDLQGTTRDEQAALLAKFLETHHPPAAQARQAIVDYLVDLEDP